MTYLLNTWYMIGWSHELSAETGPGAMVHRTIAGEPILVYRLGSGEPAAIRDRCPHRFAPLHMGKQIGDVIQCGYHGLCFGADGACVSHPVQGAPIPKAAKVRAYPAVDRWGILWVWLGDREKADPALIPDYSFLTEPGRANVFGYMVTNANYQLAIDNLADLTHVQFVHSEFQGSEAFPRIKSEVKQDGNTVRSFLTFPDGRPPAFFANAISDTSQPIDLVYEVRWDAPSCAKLTVHGYPVGNREEQLFEGQSAHIVSAETERTCHYFYGNSRTYGIGDLSADARIREWQRIGFNEQDKPMLEAQQQNVGDMDLMDLKPVLLATDAGAVRIRRVLKSMIESEVDEIAVGTQLRRSVTAFRCHVSRQGAIDRNVGVEEDAPEAAGVGQRSACRVTPNARSRTSRSSDVSSRSGGISPRAMRPARYSSS